MDPAPRLAARVVVLDEADRVLLVEFRDPSSGHRWWSTPGGGLDADESFEDAARRELVEETGLTQFDLGPCVWVREHRGEFNGERFHARERVFLVRAPAFDVSSTGWTELERRVHVTMRWWTLPELESTTDELSPGGCPSSCACSSRSGRPPSRSMPGSDG